MKKAVKFCTSIILAFTIIFAASLLRDRNALGQQLLRLHVVANSDSTQDQALKLQVRDAISAYLQQPLQQCANIQQAMCYVQTHMNELQTIACRTLEAAGCADAVRVSLQEEAFPRRDYETFSLPSGVYHALRITIGDGAGQNWWCVVFPGLCISAAAATEETAQCAAMGKPLQETITRQEGYKVRFFLLDILGRVENFFYQWR